MEKEFNSQNVVDTIITAETCPLYIPAMHSKKDRAYAYLQTLSKRSQKRLLCKINKVVRDYNTEDENGYSPCDYNQMFLQ